MPGVGTGSSVPGDPARITKDNIAINVVITFLGVFCLLGLSFIFSLLMFRDKTHMGDGLSAMIALVGTAVGSLGSILAQTRVQPLPSTDKPSEPSPARPVPEIATDEPLAQPIPDDGNRSAVTEQVDLTVVKAAPLTEAALVNPSA